MQAGTRIDVVDQLRAFALLGICLVNMPFIAAPILTGPPIDSAIDEVAAFLIAWLGAAKFFLIFAFLFGWSFGIQQRSAARAGVSFGARFGRRTLGLAILGAAHAFLIFPGDILLPYALISLLFFPLRRLSNRGLLRAAGLSVIFAALVLALLAAAIGAEPLAAEGAAFDQPTRLAALAGQRLSDWFIAFPFILLFNGPLVLGAFCLGLAAQRSGFFEPANRVYDLLRARLGKLWLAGLLLNLPFALVAIGWMDGVAAATALCLLAVAAPILAAAYVISLVEVARHARLPRNFGLAGRMSLTAYVAEGLFGTVFFLGFGLFGRVSLAWVAAFAIAVYVAVELLCAAWLGRARQGPLEALLRAVTYGRPRPAPGPPGGGTSPHV